LKKLNQISNFVYCDASLENMLIESKILPNPYKDYPFLLINNFLTNIECQDIVNEVRKSSDYEKAMVKTKVLDSVVDPSVKPKIRTTNIYTLPLHFQSIYQERFAQYQKEIEDFFSLSLNLATKEQVLEYTKGSFYIKHSDDSNEIVDSNKNTVGFDLVAPQRKITTVLFATTNVDEINDDYSFIGGELIFNYLYDKDGNNIVLKPKAGDMIAFPSNPYFCHEVKVVKDGYRLTIVQWHNAIF
jgi:SM-20-related protein